MTFIHETFIPTCISVVIGSSKTLPTSLKHHHHFNHNSSSSSDDNCAHSPGAGGGGHTANGEPIYQVRRCSILHRGKRK